MGRKARVRWLCGLAGAALSSLSLCGCVDLWEEVTSHDFTVKGLFVTPNPLVVLRDSNDGDKRAKALLALREPKRHGGSDKDQEAILQILARAASNERQPLCRLAAIESLGQFKDPRAVKGLEDAFYNANNFANLARAGTNPADTFYNAPGISPEMPVRIQCQALAALGETGNPAAVQLLTRVVREPHGEGAEQDRQQVLDVRMAAARALAKFNQPQATEALVYVLQNDRDVALRERATESLQASTGKKLPADAKAWEAALNRPGASDVHVASEGNKKLFGLFGN
ncbi:MAG TPA: HEAT repeat domain-containing protein [Gemmataceae bacterium]|jgi:HEAT repeat protein|nr:HEAT repeat domain-containing protein [Gemmataceae bacterium]